MTWGLGIIRNLYLYYTIYIQDIVIGPITSNSLGYPIKYQESYKDIIKYL